jgi:tRNA (cytidine/uridine-2'-O-)-methyltransferase
MRIALYEPDIPQNTGTILRLAACFGIGVDLIEPAGFALEDARMRRAGLDYLDRVELRRHSSWAAFLAKRSGRLLLFTTRASTAYTDFAYRADDTLLFGRESGGAPPAVHEAADARLAIPMRPGLRSLNVAVAAAMATGEALRQTGGFPAPAVAES